MIVPRFAFLAAANAPALRGATPVLRRRRLARSAATSIRRTCARQITPRTRAVVAVHMLRLRRRRWRAARAVRRARPPAGRGRRAGLGVDAASARRRSPASRFFSEKQLPWARAGWSSPTTSVAARVRLLRSHAMTSGTWDRHRGHADSYDVVDIGFNFRLDEPRAALGLSRLPKVAAEIEQRRATVRAYRERLVRQRDVRRRRRRPREPLRLRRAVRGRRDPRRACASALAAARIQTTRYPALHA